MNHNQTTNYSALLTRLTASIKSNRNIKAGDRVLAAMSGGVDSSVMAALLHHADLDVVGVSMKLSKKIDDQPNNNVNSNCCVVNEFDDAHKVACKFGFSHQTINFENKFKETVIEPFIESYITGNTPSPCIYCNQNIKFGALLKTATELNCKFMATGHYACVTQDSTGYHLMKSKDVTKDQSYFLFTHNQETLARTLFPISQLSKAEVRQLARYLEIHIADKTDSQEICFISGRYYDYVAKIKQLSTEIGDIRHINGQILGHHSGYWRFTIGQRKGIGISYSDPLFVVRIDPTTNIVWVGYEKDLLGSELIAKKISWCIKPPINQCFHCCVKIRSRSQEVGAIVCLLENNKARVVFDTPQRAIAPGQAVVFYLDNEILGGGWIEKNSCIVPNAFSRT